MTNLIAHFVFDTGNPVDIRINSEQKDEFLEDIKNGNFFRDSESDGVFYANLKHARFFYINKAEELETLTQPEEVNASSGEKKQ